MILKWRQDVSKNVATALIFRKLVSSDLSSHFQVTIQNICLLYR